MKGKMLIGWSQKDITPLKTCALAGQFRERISEYVRDPLTATALALESVDGNGNTIEQAVMISCDLLMVEKHLQDGLRIRLAQRLQELDSRKVFLFATHTHTAPFTSVDELSKFGGQALEYKVGKEGVITPSEYTEYLIGQLSEAVLEAWSHRCPGSISSELGFAVVGYNRMVVYEDGTSKMYGPTDTADFCSLAGPSDHGVELMYTWDDTGELTGVAVNVACPSQIVENMNYVSADFWGEVRKEINKRYLKSVYVLAMTGASGDQSPRDLTRPGISGREMRSEAGLEIIAKRIVNMVNEVIVSAKAKIQNELIFKHLVADIELPLRRVTRLEFKKAQKEYDRILKENKAGIDHKRAVENPDENFLYTLAVLEGILNRYRRQQKEPSYKIELHVIRLGNIVLATNPFELFTDYGLQMKSRSRARQTFIIELACDCGLYLPTARAVAGGGYSTCIFNGFVGPEGGRLLTDYIVKLANSLMAE